jgi:hypothetical protein
MKFGLGKILDGVGAIVGPILKNRNEYKSKKLDVELRILEAQATATEMKIEGDQGWEHLAIQQTGLSWKDELWTLIFAAPFVLVFIPSAQPYVKSGFAALDDVPSFYKYGLMCAWGLAFAVKADLSRLIPWGKK